MKKILLILASAGALSCGGLAFSASSSSDTALQKEIQLLQKQLDTLKSTVGVEQDATVQSAVESPKSSASSDSAPVPPLSNVSISPYVGVAPQYNGFNLIVNNPGVNNDLALLRLRESEKSAYGQAHKDYNDAPKLIFSGEIEGTSVYNTAYSNQYGATSAGTNFDLTDAELDTFIEGNRWVSGYITLAYNSGQGSSNGNVNQANAVNNSEVQLGQGYITIGDLSQLPFYGTAGQMYVPFGRYLSYMISNPSSKTLGRIQTRAVNFGYYPGSGDAVKPFAAIFGYQGASEIDGTSSNSTMQGVGGNLGLSFEKGDYSAELGMSYVSNIADSAGLQGSGASGSGFSASSSDEELAKRVPGADVHGQVSYKDYTLLAEYVQATKKFAEQNLSYNGQGAEPKALDIEAAYSFEWWRPSYVAAAYGESWQSLSLSVPKKNYGIVYSTAVWRNTALSLEFMHNIGYSSDSTATIQNSTIENDTVGQSYNTVTLRFDLFF